MPPIPRLPKRPADDTPPPRGDPVPPSADASNALADCVDRWREARWRYEVVSRIVDSEIELYLKGGEPVPADQLSRLEKFRRALTEQCEAMIAAARSCVARPTWG